MNHYFDILVLINVLKIAILKDIMKIRLIMNVKYAIILVRLVMDQLPLIAYHGFYFYFIFYFIFI